MSESVKASRSTVTLGSLTIDGFMLPNGEYRMSQTQMAETVAKPEINARRFLDSKGIKALLGKGYTPDTVEVESTDQVRGQTRINAVPLPVVTAHWFTQARAGNEQALSLVWALLTETLERRFDRAFGVTRSEEERDQLVVERMQHDAELSAAFEEADVATSRERLLEQRFRDMGIDPWAVPGDES